MICELNTGIRFQTAWHRHTPCPKNWATFIFAISLCSWPILTTFHHYNQKWSAHINGIKSTTLNLIASSQCRVIFIYSHYSTYYLKNEKDVTVIVSVFANSDTNSFTYCEIISTWCQLNTFRMILLNSAGQCICILRSWNCQLLLCRKDFIPIGSVALEQPVPLPQLTIGYE